MMIRQAVSHTWKTGDWHFRMLIPVIVIFTWSFEFLIKRGVELEITKEDIDERRSRKS
jgi:hypothetical protein